MIGQGRLGLRHGSVGLGNRAGRVEDVLGPLAAAIGGPGASAKAALAMSVLIGSNFLRNVLPVIDLVSADEELLKTSLLRLPEQALSPAA